MRILKPDAVVTEGQKPFLDRAYELGIVIEDEEIEIIRVKETQKRNGFLIETHPCVILLYKSSPWISVLLATLDELMATSPSFKFVVIVRPDEPQGIELAVDEEHARIWQKEKKFGGGEAYIVRTLDSPALGTGRKARRLGKDT